ncbi:hypothetical protein A2U01_0008043, partial [Trifolium medium]|nr:hypothetical protein [Trifolium medium]
GLVVFVTGLGKEDHDYRSPTIVIGKGLKPLVGFQVCGVFLSCGPGALTPIVSPELPRDSPTSGIRVVVRLGRGVGGDPGLGSTI